MNWENMLLNLNKMEIKLKMLSAHSIRICFGEKKTNNKFNSNFI